MRGRAIDATSGWSTSGLYSNVYNEFKGSYSTPINYNSTIWRSRVSGTSNDKTGAYAIEKMPQTNSDGTQSWWLHLEVAPKSENGY